jgi:hypothetical protein
MSVVNNDIEKFYTKISDCLVNVGAHTKIDNITNIIKTCRLKPYTVFTNKSLKLAATFEKHWVDEFGNSLMLDNKTSTIIINDAQLINNTKISSDLFFGSSIKYTMSNSKMLFIATGNYFANDFSIFSFYGQDEYLRTFVNYKLLYRVSPLLLGLNTIREILKSTKNKQPIEIDKKYLDLVIPFEIKRCVLTNLPTKDIPAHFSTVINSII